MVILLLVAKVNVHIILDLSLLALEYFHTLSLSKNFQAKKLIKIFQT